MALTVNQLARLSKISVRTLHWYDKIGLLKPSYIGSNGYRYYEDAQIFQLQRIMFYKELGLSLPDVQSLLQQNTAMQIKTLQSHKHVLETQLKNKKMLLHTVNQTIEHLEGKTMMSNEQLFEGFDLDKQEEYEQYLVKAKGLKAEELLAQSKILTAKWDKEEWDTVKKIGDALHTELAKCISTGFEPDSMEVQTLIEEHFLMTSRFYTVTYEVYWGLADLYLEHPDFQPFFDAYHKDMIPYLQKGMRIYADLNLKDCTQ